MRPDWVVLVPLILRVVRHEDGRFDKDDVQKSFVKEFKEDNPYTCLAVASFPPYEADPNYRDYNYRVLTGLVQVMWLGDGDNTKVFYYVTEDSEPYTAKVEILKGSDEDLYKWFQLRCEQINQLNDLQRSLSYPCPYTE